MLGEREPAQPLAEVLDHVLALGLAVHEHVEADVLLVGDHLGDRALQEALVASSGCVRAARISGVCGNEPIVVVGSSGSACRSPLRRAAHLERRVALVGGAAPAPPAHLRVSAPTPGARSDLARRLEQRVAVAVERRLAAAAQLGQLLGANASHGRTRRRCSRAAS